MQQVRSRVEASRPAPEAEGRRRPDVDVATVLVQVPAPAAARGPHRAGAHRLDLGGVGVLGGPGRLHGGEAVVAGIMR